MNQIQNVCLVLCNDKLYLKPYSVVCLVNCCWPSTAESFVVPSPAGLMIIFYCLTALGVVKLDSDSEECGCFRSDLVCHKLEATEGINVVGRMCLYKTGTFVGLQKEFKEFSADSASSGWLLIVDLQINK
jgi:hypothetical protein